MFPPNGARLDLATRDGKPDPIALKLTGGSSRSPCWSTASRCRRNRADTLFFTPDGPGFARLTVMDAPAQPTAWWCGLPTAPRPRFRRPMPARLFPVDPDKTRRKRHNKRRFGAQSAIVQPRFPGCDVFPIVRRKRQIPSPINLASDKLCIHEHDRQRSSAGLLASQGPRRTRRFRRRVAPARRAALLILVSLLAFLPGFFHIPPVDRDEALFRAGDQADDRDRRLRRHPLSRTTCATSKPVGIYWLQAGVVKAGARRSACLPRAHDDLALSHTVAARRDRRGAG